MRTAPAATRPRPDVVLGPGLGRHLIRRFAAGSKPLEELPARFVAPRPCRASDLIEAIGQARAAGVGKVIVGDVIVEV